MRIFCEGEDDKGFITSLLKHLAKEGNLNLEIKEYGQYVFPKNGKSHLLNSENYNTEKKLIGKRITKALFIFDADFHEDDAKIGGYENSEKAIENLIEVLDWNIEVDYYIFDKNLDDFIIKTLCENQQKCFRDFDKCLDIETKNKNKKISTCIYKKLYPQKPYDFSHKNFECLKEKLKELFEKSNIHENASSF